MTLRILSLPSVEWCPETVGYLQLTMFKVGNHMAEKCKAFCPAFKATRDLVDNLEIFVKDLQWQQKVCWHHIQGLQAGIKEDIIHVMRYLGLAASKMQCEFDFGRVHDWRDIWSQDVFQVPAAVVRGQSPWNQHLADFCSRRLSETFQAQVQDQTLVQAPVQDQDQAQTLNVSNQEADEREACDEEGMKNQEVAGQGDDAKTLDVTESEQTNVEEDGDKTSDESESEEEEGCEFGYKDIDEAQEYDHGDEGDDDEDDVNDTDEDEHEAFHDFPQGSRESDLPGYSENETDEDDDSLDLSLENNEPSSHNTSSSDIEGLDLDQPEHGYQARGCQLFREAMREAPLKDIFQVFEATWGRSNVPSPFQSGELLIIYYHIPPDNNPIISF